MSYIALKAWPPKYQIQWGKRVYRYAHPCIMLFYRFLPGIVEKTVLHNTWLMAILTFLFFSTAEFVNYVLHYSWCLQFSFCEVIICTICMHDMHMPLVILGLLGDLFAQTTCIFLFFTILECPQLCKHFGDTSHCWLHGLTIWWHSIIIGVWWKTQNCWIQDLGFQIFMHS